MKEALTEAQTEAEAAEQHFESEQARFQAEMEQQIEQIQEQLEAQRQALEVRWKVINTATAVAQQQVQLVSLKIQQLQRQQAAQVEVKRQAEQAHLTAQWQSPTFANVGSTAVFGPAFTGTNGTVNVGPAASVALRAALRAAVAAAIAALSTVAAPVLVGFATLLAPSRLGNGDLYSVSVPLSELASVSDEDLYELAAAGGEIDLPVRLGSKTTGNRVEVVVASTDGVTVPANVPVRLAHFDARKNAYVAASTAPNGPVVTWTPLVEPQNPSTDFPLVDTDLPIYEGATVTPDTGRIDPFPELDRYGFGGFIYVFPIESGIPPQYVVFNTPYEGAIVEGQHSGRDFNPEQTGGPTLDMKWEPAIASQEGTDIVKLHTSKFLPSDANKVMIDRLDRILRGEIEMTDTDRRFYTHEIREFERFKALGYGDTEMPDPDSPVWNNVHTATLEDFKLKDDPSLLYTPEALAAAAEQDERDYQRFLKEIWK